MSQQAEVIAQVRAVIGRIPVGNVSSYGEVGKVAGCGPRYVGWVLKHHGADLPWWRVVRADGRTHDPARAQEHWAAEAIAFSGDRVDMSRYGVDAREL